MRLYRGLKKPYRPNEVRARAEGVLDGTDFTDCPFTALAYASGRHGVVLVLDIPDVALNRVVTEEAWFVEPAKRLMVWGTFDRWLVAVIPAKDLRAELRTKGNASLPPSGKSEVLRWSIARRISRGEDQGGGSVGPTARRER